MKRMTTIALALALSALCCKATSDETSAVVDTAWPSGDATRGRTAFVDLGCNSCHQVAGSDLPPPSASPAVPIKLGGGHARSHTTAELITAIVNPSHEIAEGFDDQLVKSGGGSRMGDYSYVMTVQQLVDIVAYLDTVHGGSTLGGDEPAGRLPEH